MIYKSPTTKQEYWAIVNHYWQDIFDILDANLSLNGRQWIDETSIDKRLGDFILALRDTKNPRLARAFNAALYNCPEDKCGEWAFKNWNIFNDLCLKEKCLIEKS